MGLRVTPLSLTNVCTVLPMTWVQGKSDKILNQEILPRLIALVTATFFQALDLVLNLVLGLAKLPLSILHHLDVKFFAKDDWSIHGVGQHFKKSLKCIPGLFASVIGPVYPKFITKFLCSKTETTWNYADKPIGLNTFYAEGRLLNLERRKDRLDGMNTHLGEIDVDRVQRFDAIDMDKPKQLTDALIHFGIIDRPDQLAEYLTRVQGKSLEHKKGRTACFLGHLRMYEELKNSGNGLILEDDARFTKSSKRALEKAKSELEGEDWDVLYLSCEHEVPSKAILGKDSLVEVVDGRCTHSFIINGKDNGRVYETLIEKLVAHMVSGSEVLAIDMVFKDIWAEGDLRALCLNPMIVDQMIDYSDIEGHQTVRAMGHGVVTS